MELLKKENWWVWLILTIFTGGSNYIFLAVLLDCYDKDAWYANWKYWLIGFLCLVLPATIMFMVFIIEMTCKAASKLEVPGYEIYLSPYIWLLCMIIPVLGWIFLLVMMLYLTIWPMIKLAKGNGEKYIK